MLNNDYIIPSLAGRMGNHMFMIAHAYAKALEYNKQLVIARNQLVDGNNGDDYSKHIFRKIETIDRFDDNLNWNPLVPTDDKHTQYAGYFQDENYFEKYSEAIRSLYAPTPEFIERIKKEIPQLFNIEITLISVRRGDYLYYPNYHPVVSKEYLRQTASIIPTKMYLIASDDIPWCKENLHFSNAMYLEGYQAHEQMWIMAMCHHFIISNSSFSWWGAWLSRFPNKIVIAPSVWFGPEGPQNWQNMYAKKWTIFPSKFENGLIIPQ